MYWCEQIQTDGSNSMRWEQVDAQVTRVTQTDPHPPTPHPHYMLGISHNWGTTEMVITFYCSFYLPSNISQCSIQGRRIWSANHIYRLRQHFFRSSITSRYLRWLPPPSHHLRQKKLLKIFKQDALRNCQKVQLWSVKLDKFNDSFFAQHSHIRYKHFNWFAFFKQFLPRKKPLASTH